MELRIFLPDTLSGWRYILRNPRSLISGRYGRKEFIRQRDIMLNMRSQRDHYEIKYRQTLADLVEVRKELSKLKRNKKPE